MITSSYKFPVFSQSLGHFFLTEQLWKQNTISESQTVEDVDKNKLMCLDSGGLPINRLIGLSRSFSLIGLGFGHLIFWIKYLA